MSGNNVVNETKQVSFDLSEGKEIVEQSTNSKEISPPLNSTIQKNKSLPELVSSPEIRRAAAQSLSGSIPSVPTPTKIQVRLQENPEVIKEISYEPYQSYHVNYQPYQYSQPYQLPYQPSYQLSYQPPYQLPIKPVQSENKNNLYKSVSAALYNKLDNNKEFQKNTNDNIITYGDVEKSIYENFSSDEMRFSTALDIISLYLKGQKIIYIESKSFCEYKLNCLMFPVIFISAICTVLNFSLTSYSFGTILIASLNAFNSFILSLITYLKLDAKAEAHKISAYKFQKLESYCEFQAGKILFLETIKSKEEIIEKIENQVLEIKEANQFVIPYAVRIIYPNIYSTNIFSLVKKIQNSEIILINNMKNILTTIYELKTEKNKLDTSFAEINEKIKNYEEIILNIKRQLIDVSIEEEYKKEKQHLELHEKEILNYTTRFTDINKKIVDNNDKIKIQENMKKSVFENIIKSRNDLVILNDLFLSEIDSNNNVDKCNIYCCDT